MLVLAAIGSAVSFVVWPHLPSLISGIFLGTVVTMGRFLALEHSVDGTLAQDTAKKASQRANLNYLLRQLVTGLIFLIAALNPAYVHLLGVLFGVATLQIAIHVYRLLDKKQHQPHPGRD